MQVCVVKITLNCKEMHILKDQVIYCVCDQTNCDSPLKANNGPMACVCERIQHICARTCTGVHLIVCVPSSSSIPPLSRSLSLCQIYTYEMSIIKVVDGDAGGYRCEVTSKDKCDSCIFEVSVQGRSGDRQSHYCHLPFSVSTISM